MTTRYSSRHIDSDKLILWLAASWGFCTFFPVGVGYLHLLTLALIMGFSADRRARAAQLLGSGFKWPLLLFMLWPLAVAVIGPWYDDTAGRLFHVMRAVPGLAVVVWMLLLFAVKAWAARTEFGAAAFLLVTAVITTAMFNALLRDAAFGLSLLWLMGACAAAMRTRSPAATRPLPTE